MRRENSVRYSNCTLEEADLCAANLGSKHLNDARPHATSFLTRILLVSHEQRDFDAPHAIEGSSNRAHFCWIRFGWILGGNTYMEESVCIIHIFVNKFKDI